MATMLLFVGGCQSNKPIETIVKPKQVKVETRNPELLFQETIKHLQNGERSAANQKLSLVIQLSPEHKAALDIKAQIEKSAAGYFKHTDVKNYLVKSGDSLAKISAKHLGSEFKFVALAKLNKIQNPSLIQAGQALVIPILPNSIIDVSQKKVKKLIEENKFIEAETLVAKIDDLDVTNRLIVDVALAHATQLKSRGLIERAKEKLNLVINNPMAPDEKITHAKNMLKDLQLVEIKEVIQLAYSAKDSQKMLNLLSENASEFSRLNKNKKTKRAISWLFEKKHGEAVSLFRQQELEKAISVWDTLIAINPNFEPAKVYKNRAQLLLKKLQKINN